MTTKDVAKYLKLHEVTIIGHAAKGLIPGIKIGGRWRFNKQAIDKWVRGEKKYLEIKGDK
jgi:excisionase family DNA binding protein